VHGVTYSIDDVGSDRTGTRTVFVIPSQPGDGSLHALATQIVDWALTGGPYVVAAGFLAIGLRKRRMDRRKGTASFGVGLDQALVAHLLSDRRSSTDEPPAR